MKTLKDILEVYQAKSKDERRFVDKHIVVKHKDRNGNGDDVFQATNIKAVGREAERHGYEPGKDEAVYEETETVDEGKFTKSLNAIRTGGGPVGAILRNRAAKELKKSRNMPAGNDPKSAEAGAKQFTKAAIAHSAAPRREETEHLEEKLKVSDGMGAWITDFQESDAPQFDGKNKKERKKMAIAAFLSAKRGE